MAAAVVIATKGPSLGKRTGQQLVWTPTIDPRWVQVHVVAAAAKAPISLATQGNSSSLFGGVAFLIVPRLPFGFA